MVFNWAFKGLNVEIGDRRSRWTRGLRRSSAAARLLGLRVRIPPGEWLSVCRECCVLSGRDICDGLICPPEKSYRVCVCFIECDQMQQQPSAPTVGR
jgi:hypothetical protein